MLQVVCFLVVIFTAFYYFLRKNYAYWASRGIIQDKPTLVFGSFYNVAIRKEHSSDRIRQIYCKYSNEPYVGFYGFIKPLLLVRDPVILKKILIKDFKQFINRITTFNERNDPIAYHSIFNLRDNQWRNMRTKLSPIFTSGKMKLMLPLMMECGENLRKIIIKTRNNDVEIRDLMKRYSIDIISSCAFGVNANCIMDLNSEIYKNAINLADPNSTIRNLSMLCYFFMPKFVDLLRLNFFDLKSTNYLIELFKTTLYDRGKNNIERNDFINMLEKLKMEHNGNFEFDDIKMASQAITFFAAGTITTAMIITCTLYEFALNKSIQNQLRDEITQSYKKHNGFTYESIQQMKYLHMVVCETLRKYPFGVFINRVAVDDYIIEETGCKIEKGTTIIVPVLGLHFDPKYFPNPYKYDPERFNDENKHKIVPCTYMPFGDGPRNCLGQRFGLLSAKVALIHLIKDLEFDISKRTKIPLKMSKKSIFLQTEDEVPLIVNSIKHF